MTLPLQSPPALMARNISSQERNPPASPPWALTAWPPYQAQPGEHPQHPCEQKSPLHNVHPDVAPRRGRRQGTALPCHFQVSRGTSLFRTLEHCMSCHSCPRWSSWMLSHTTCISGPATLTCSCTPRTPRQGPNTALCAHSGSSILTCPFTESGWFDRLPALPVCPRHPAPSSLHPHLRCTPLPASMRPALTGLVTQRRFKADYF